MENSRVNIIFGILSLLLIAGIIWGIGSIVKSGDGMKAEPEQATEIAAKAAYEAPDDTVETTTQAETTEEVTEEITEMPTEELTAEDDREAPVFLTISNNCEIKQGDVFDINDYIGYGDDVDRSPVLSVEGTVDTAVPGTYPLTLSLEDSAGHVANANMNVNVVTEITSYQGGGSKMEFGTFSEIYKTEDTVLGIDVSRWQEDIDFAQVKNAGCDFAIIRIGGYDDGSRYVDKYYKANIRNAKAAGLLVGIYWHAEESSVQEVKDNVAYMMEILDGEKLDFPIAYDWEDFSGFQDYGMNLNDLNSCFEAFCDEVKSYGYDACLYSSKNFLENVWVNENRHPVWLANYTSQTTYAGEYFMWQQGNTGRIAGIGTDVDFDIWYQK